MKNIIKEFDERMETRGRNGFFWNNGNLNPDALKRFVHQKFRAADRKQRKLQRMIKELGDVKPYCK